MPDRDLIAEGRRLLATATPGPLEVANRAGIFVELHSLHRLAPGKDGYREIIGRGLPLADAGLFVHLRNTYGELLDELEQARKALDDIARRVQPDEDGTWTDRDGLLKSIGDTIESTGRKVWEVDRG